MTTAGATDANGNWTITVPVGTTTADIAETTLPGVDVQTGTDPTITVVGAGITVETSLAMGSSTYAETWTWK
jgi:hypothetical protein